MLVLGVRGVWDMDFLVGEYAWEFEVEDQVMLHAVLRLEVVIEK